MTTREQAIRLCLEQPGSYEDYPFGPEWAIIRHRAGNKMFAAIFERQGRVWLNLKAAPEWGEFWRRVYPSVVPAFHMNKRHWVSVILDGSVPVGEIERMVGDSFRLTEVRGRKKGPSL